MERNIEVATREAAPANTAKALFFAAAGISFFASISLYFSGDTQGGIYVGLWVPSILAAGTLLLGGLRHD